MYDKQREADLDAFLSDPSHQWIAERPVTDPSWDSALHLHYAEREHQGFSHYDWWNFHIHFLWLIKQSCHAIIAGKVEATNDVARYATQVLGEFLVAKDIADAAEVYAEESDALLANTSLNELMWDLSNPDPNQSAYLDKLFKYENDEHEHQKKAVDIFFDHIFRELPVATLAHYVPVNTGGLGRARNGMNDQDMTVLRSYLSSILINGITMCTSTHAHGYHGESVDAWRVRLRKIVAGLELLQASSVRPLDKKEQAACNDSITDLKDAFFYLWD